jgi:formyltetrahydrofolate-dependent phosphoribosylglycinamide formyltransferase
MQDAAALSAPFDRPVRLGVLISGGGTTLTNFIEKIAAGQLQAQVAIVIASRNCTGIEKAQRAGLTTLLIPRRDFASVDDYSRAVFAELQKAEVDLVALAGFLSLLAIPPEFQHRVLNIHPALLPMFGGKGYFGHNVHDAALERGVKVSGCTVHFADNVYDHGPIILQRCVEVLEGDTAETLAARIFEAECEIYPEAVNLYATGRLRIEGQVVRITASR